MKIDTTYIQDQLKRRLSERQLSAVARGTKLSTRTLSNIIQGKPGRTSVAETVQGYLKRTEKMERLENAGK